VSAMSETELQAVEPSAPDASVPPVEENEAAPSPAVNDADENEVIRAAKGVGKRIDELTRLRRDAERDRDHWRDLALRQSPQPKAEAPKPVESTKTLADFEYNEVKYQAYVFDEAKKLSTEAAKQALREERESEAKVRRTTSFASRESEFAKTVSDYHDVTRNPELPMTQGMVEAIAESEDGPALAYHLGKNPEIAEKLATLPPVAAAREIGKIEARLAYEREKAKEAKPAISKAPPPPPKVDGAEAPTTVRIDGPEADTLSDEEWARRRNKQLARRR
jgi:hypothetical protein